MKQTLLTIAFLVAMVLSITVTGQNKAVKITDRTTRMIVQSIPETSSDWTFEAWINLSEILTDYTGIVDARASSEPGASALVLRNEGNTRQYLGYEWGGQWAFGTGPDLQINKWQHVALVVSSATMMSYMYLDGELKASDSAYPNLGMPVTLGGNPAKGDMRIGNSNNMDERTLLGMMDEVRVWKVARSADEIKANMNVSVSPASTGLLCQFKCNGDDPAGTLKDATGKYNAELTGGAIEFVASDVVLSNSEMATASFKVYPTITRQIVHVSGLASGAKVNVINADGKVVASCTSDGKLLGIPVSGFNPGIYLVNAGLGSKSFSARFIVKK